MSVTKLPFLKLDVGVQSPGRFQDFVIAAAFRLTNARGGASATRSKLFGVSYSYRPSAWAGFHFCELSLRNPTDGYVDSLQLSSS